MEGEYDSSRIGPAQTSVFRSSDQIRDVIRQLIEVIGAEDVNDELVIG